VRRQQNLRPTCSAAPGSLKTLEPGNVIWLSDRYLSPRISTLSSQDRCLPLPVAISYTPLGMQYYIAHIPYRTHYTHIIPYHASCHVMPDNLSLIHSGLYIKMLTTISHLPLRCPFHSFVFCIRSFQFIRFPSSVYIPFLLPSSLGPSPFRMPLWPRPKNSLSSFLSKRHRFSMPVTLAFRKF